MAGFHTKNLEDVVIVILLCFCERTFNQVANGSGKESDDCNWRQYDSSFHFYIILKLDCLFHQALIACFSPWVFLYLLISSSHMCNWSSNLQSENGGLQGPDFQFLGFTRGLWSWNIVETIPLIGVLWLSWHFVASIWSFLVQSLTFFEWYAFISTEPLATRTHHERTDSKEHSFYLWQLWHERNCPGSVKNMLLHPYFRAESNCLNV